MKIYQAIFLILFAIQLSDCSKRKVRGDYGDSNRSTPSDGSQDSSQGDEDELTEAERIARQALISQNMNVIWKRSKALELSIASALRLSPADMCVVGSGSNCISQAFLPLLGGNDAFTKGQYLPPASPSRLTPSVVDRVLLSSCIRRAELDQAAAPQIFKQFSLAGSAAAVSDQQLDALSDLLYKEFLARKPSQDQLEILRKLKDQSATAFELAVLTCFTVSTQTEFLFY